MTFKQVNSMRICQNAFLDNYILYEDHKVIIFLQFAHWTFTPLPFIRSNFLEPQLVQIGHERDGILITFDYPC